MSKISTFLKKPNQNFELSYLGIRRAVGILGLALPIAVSLGTAIFSAFPHLKDSISDYYYTIMGNVFTGTLCGVALFLFSYNGFDRWDRISSNLAAVFALGVAFFPMNVDRACKACTLGNIISRDVQPWRDYVHFTSASLLFFTLACMSLFLFTKTQPGKRPTHKKQQRNIIYRVCGIVMLAAMVLAFGYQKGWITKVLPLPHSTFFMETVMLWSFGFSWLVKGETLLKD
jgi:hypothetical protein